jgi:hypothetical protein
VEPKLHPEVAHLAFLLGTWEGDGEGDFPTTEPFTYRERVTFEHVGDDFLLYSQGSWTPGGEPIHFERGVLRPAGEDRVEMTLAHPIGVTEVSEGTLDGTTLALRSTHIGRSATASPVTAIARRYAVDDDVLTYELDMATDEVPLTFHVRSSLRRV